MLAVAPPEAVGAALVVNGGSAGTTAVAAVPRPPGRLRRYQQPILPASTRLWATPLYRLVYDPDARPRRMRRRNLY
jgi:hypothetical protein